MDGLNIIVLLGLALTLISVLSLLIERLFFSSILAFIAIGVGVGFFWDGNEVFKVAGEIGNHSFVFPTRSEVSTP